MAEDLLLFLPVLFLPFDYLSGLPELFFRLCPNNSPRSSFLNAVVSTGHSPLFASFGGENGFFIFCYNNRFDWKSSRSSKFCDIKYGV